MEAGQIVSKSCAEDPCKDPRGGQDEQSEFA